ncbi:hypothetical protein [Kitasatospora sp. MAA4]|uniref:hypothetical protein n=1 Tax=Kitasatospora sp. MAA4 TaxID=3035093 RepID=UPI002473800B|nr:hypothetical protein [Kitasatospora sp. MAA4]
MSTACAASGPPVESVRAVDATGPVGRPAADRPGEPSLLSGSGLAGDAAGSTGAVDQLLRNQIRGGGLPLPGQATAVPDAFAIAAVLLPAVPAQASGHSSGSGASRSSSGSAGGGRAGSVAGAGTIGIPAARAGSGLSAGDAWSADGDAKGGWGADPGGRPDGTAARTVSAADEASAAVLAARTADLAASRDSGRAAVGAPRGAAAGEFGGLTGAGAADGDQFAAAATGNGRTVAARYAAAADPLSATGSENAVLIPIAAGLLLTGAAMYKHRGLPRGH